MARWSSLRWWAWRRRSSTWSAAATRSRPTISSRSRIFCRLARVSSSIRRRSSSSAKRCNRSSMRSPRRPRRALVSEFRRLDSASPDFAATFARLTACNTAQDEAIDTSVSHILADVRIRGDAAVLEYTALFDRVKAASVAELELVPSELAAAFDSLDGESRDALVEASGRIREFHEHQRGKSASN